ncbi:pyridoxal phosphate-dependent decarboxylase family protein [Halomarina halobia]|uniref:Pyridoxal phosphate-dependent decarboxylase family protein n=1 Tax=Halomarina halobia TaxID=3033386 RepID=A0ABD6A5J6_9EURY|nr:aspartate aminotransferase family protein [Halomarina sp. PSR21]
MSGVPDYADGRTTAETLFLGGEGSAEAYRTAMRIAEEAVVETIVEGDAPYSGRSPERLRARLADLECLPEEGVGFERAVRGVSDLVLADSVNVSHPACVAHLQCPPLVPSLAAEAMLTATNQSLDSWDQSPAASVLEERFVGRLAELFGYGEDADGVFTGGGTASNFLGLLLARNRHLAEEHGRDARRDGLPPEAADLRILCSTAAHFTAEQAAAHLGLGERAVVEVETDDDYRLSPAALDAALSRLDADGREPFALVGTAGTTDFGSVDPLDALADRAEERGLWFHVDAAYGGALALSDRHRDRLAGIERADSVAVDFHKLFYQPISCGLFLLRDGDDYRHVARNAAYLNPEGDDAAGVPNLVSKSTQTTRRFDALKPLVAFRTLGRRRLAALVEYTLDLADEVAARIAADPDLELATEPALNAVVFRYVPSSAAGDGGRADRINESIRDALLAEGDAVLARTEVGGRTHLKFTLLNPRTTVEDAEGILRRVTALGRDLDAAEVGR